MTAIFREFSGSDERGFVVHGGRQNGDRWQLILLANVAGRG